MRYTIDTLRGRVNTAAFYLREYFFPLGCPLCGAALADSRESWYGLCSVCHEMIQGECAQNRAEESCDYCGRPLISEMGRCLSCRRGETRAVDQVRVLFPYTGKYRQLLSAYKFGKTLALGHFFAEHIGQALQRDTDSGVFPRDAIVVPVPPRPGKVRETGWDQVEYIARLLEKTRAVDRCLKRMPSKSQKELGRENRRRNLSGRIAAVKQAAQAVVIIDDVMTTGSTLDACAAALKARGARTVYGLCLFYD